MTLRQLIASICIFICSSLMLSAQGNPPDLPTYATGETLAVVNAPRVNVRSLPSDTDPESIIHTIIKMGNRYPALAISEDGDWVLIRITGDTAWVSRDALLLTNPEKIRIFGQVTPEEDAAMRELTAQLVAYINSTVGVRDNLNIRFAPGIRNPIVGRIPYNQRAYPLASNNTNTWYQVNYQGTVGWVSAVYVTFPATIRRPVITGSSP